MPAPVAAPLHSHRKATTGGAAVGPTPGSMRAACSTAAAFPTRSCGRRHRTAVACRIDHFAGHNPAGHRRPSPGCRCRAMSRGVGRIVDRSAPFAANFAGGLVAAYRRSTSRTLLAFVGAPEPATDKDHSLFGSAHLVHVDGVRAVAEAIVPAVKRNKRTRRSHDICV